VHCDVYSRLEVPESAGLVSSLFPSSANNSERFREIPLAYLRGADILPMSQRRDEGEKKMKTLKVQHPTGEWVEVYQGTDDAVIQAMIARYVLDMNLRCQVVEQV
jgi:hypothetical protein